MLQTYSPFNRLQGTPHSISLLFPKDVLLQGGRKETLSYAPAVPSHSAHTILPCSPPPTYRATTRCCRLSRGNAAALAAHKVSSNMVWTVWELLDGRLLQPRISHL